MSVQEEESLLYIKTFNIIFSEKGYQQGDTRGTPFYVLDTFRLLMETNINANSDDVGFANF